MNSMPAIPPSSPVITYVPNRVRRLLIPEYAAAVGLAPCSWILCPSAVRLIRIPIPAATSSRAMNRTGMPPTVAFPTPVRTRGAP